MTTTEKTTLSNSNLTGTWTDEKHVNFLKSMEASFVRAMFERNRRQLRLDRHLPDTSDSTLDLKKHRPKTHVNPAAAAAAGDIIGSRRTINMESKADRRTTRRHSYQPYTSSKDEDQVVPQMENRRGDN